MQYTLTGFTHDAGFRVFAFEGIGVDRVRTAYSVKADMALARKYGIRVQELPLLCREILDRSDGAEQIITMLEGEMSLRALAAAAATQQRRKGPRARPVVTAEAEIALSAAG